MRLSKYAFTFLIIFFSSQATTPRKKQLKTVEKVKLVARNIEIHKCPQNTNTNTRKIILQVLLKDELAD
jgi:hypothetical protein